MQHNSDTLNALENDLAQPAALQMLAEKKLYVKSWGCQMNLYDSERMKDILQAKGYGIADKPAQADLIILNTCHIREKATDKLYSELGRLGSLKRNRPNLKIVVAGCVAQAEGEEIFRRAQMVDFLVGPQNYQTLPDLLDQAQAHEDALNAPPIKPLQLMATDFPANDKFDALPSPRDHAGSVSAFLSIQEGCDKFCSFCVVPYTRGAEYSRPADAIIAEAKQLLAKGVREITLLGQNVNAWHGQPPRRIAGGTDQWGFSALLQEISALDGLLRLRYTTSHPNEVDENLIASHRDLAPLMPLLHLPVQSGSDRILKAMNRKHTAQTYLDMIARFRDLNPAMAFSSDFIVGYPDEREEDHQATLDLIEKIGFASSFSFKYSPRPGTPAAQAQAVDEPIQDRRLQELQALLESQQAAFNQSMIGKTIPILLEKSGKYDGQLVGRSPYLQPVHVNLPDDWLGKEIMCHIDSLEAYSLFATPVSSAPSHSPD